MRRPHTKVSIFAAILLACVLAVPHLAQAGPIELTYSIFFPASHVQCKLGDAWAKEIESRTGGKVKITVYPGGTLTKAPQCYAGVVDGISDIGMSLFAYTRGRFPMMEAADLPLGYPDGKVATKVVNAFYQSITPKELADVKVMYLTAHGPGRLHTKKPVRTIADMQKMKIRCTGFSAKVVEALGGVPVAMGQGGAYEALQKGVVEGTFGPIEVLKGWNQAEVVDYTTDCYKVGYTTTFFVVMNLDKWNQLPADVQQVIDTVNAEWIDKHGQAWNEADAAGRAYTLQQKNEVITLSDEEMDRWTEKVRPVIAEYITTAEGKGIPAKENVALLQDLIRKNSGP